MLYVENCTSEHVEWDTSRPQWSVTVVGFSHRSKSTYACVRTTTLRWLSVHTWYLNVRVQLILSLRKA